MTIRTSATRTAHRSLAACLAIALVATTAAAPVQAGQRERDVLKGVLATVLVGALINSARKSAAQPRPATPVYSPAPVYTPAPVYVAPVPPVNSYQPPGVHTVPAALAFNELNASNRRAIQQQLAIWGYYTGSIDGAWGPKTWAAVQAYARDTGRTTSLDSRGGSGSLYAALLA